MKVTVSQFALPSGTPSGTLPALPGPLAEAIARTAIAAVLDTRAASLPSGLSAAPLALPPLPDDKLAGVAFEALGLALKRLTAGGRLVATGLSLAAHLVPVLAPHAPHFRMVSWVCRMGDKTIMATAELPRQPGGA